MAKIVFSAAILLCALAAASAARATVEVHSMMASSAREDDQVRTGGVGKERANVGGAAWAG